MSEAGSEPPRGPVRVVPFDPRVGFDATEPPAPPPRVPRSSFRPWGRAGHAAFFATAFTYLATQFDVPVEVVTPRARACLLLTSFAAVWTLLAVAVVRATRADRWFWSATPGWFSKLTACLIVVACCCTVGDRSRIEHALVENRPPRETLQVFDLGNQRSIVIDTWEVGGDFTPHTGTCVYRRRTVAGAIGYQWLEWSDYRVDVRSRRERDAIVVVTGPESDLSEMSEIVVPIDW